MEKKNRSNSAKLLQDLLSPRGAERKEFRWQEILAAWADVTARHSKEAEDLLASVLDYEGDVRLAPDSDLPDVMSPADMLKSNAIRILAEWTGPKYLHAFVRVCAKTQSPVLAAVARTHVEKFGGHL